MRKPAQPVPMPPLTGRGYDELDIQQGATASQEHIARDLWDVPNAERQPGARGLLRDTTVRAESV
jgi:hypothetical protein